MVLLGLAHLALDGAEFLAAGAFEVPRFGEGEGLFAEGEEVLAVGCNEGYPR